MKKTLILSTLLAAFALTTVSTARAEEDKKAGAEKKDKGKKKGDKEEAKGDKAEKKGGGGGW